MARVLAFECFPTIWDGLISKDQHFKSNRLFKLEQKLIGIWKSYQQLLSQPSKQDLCDTAIFKRRRKTQMGGPLLVPVKGHCFQKAALQVCRLQIGILGGLKKGEKERKR